MVQTQVYCQLSYPAVRSARLKVDSSATKDGWSTANLKQLSSCQSVCEILLTILYQHGFTFQICANSAPPVRCHSLQPPRLRAHPLVSIATSVPALTSVLWSCCRAASIRRGGACSCPAGGGLEVTSRVDRRLQSRHVRGDHFTGRRSRRQGGSVRDRCRHGHRGIRLTRGRKNAPRQTREGPPHSDSTPSRCLTRSDDAKRSVRLNRRQLARCLTAAPPCC